MSRLNSIEGSHLSLSLLCDGEAWLEKERCRSLFARRKHDEEVALQKEMFEKAMCLYREDANDKEALPVSLLLSREKASTLEAVHALCKNIDLANPPEPSAAPFVNAP